MSKQQNAKVSRTLIEDLKVDADITTELSEKDLKVIVGGLRPVASTCHQSGGYDCD
ncbi:MAG: hypothetical protein KME21_17945 [Desmonostoc vinosum HA7617-LM4]|jgi:bacteriocin-like protein|nr:hypothetical protein [Desmonostoc vinosum HA7617-LM4]